MGNKYLSNKQITTQCDHCKNEATSSHVFLKEANLCESCACSVKDDDVEIDSSLVDIDVETGQYAVDTINDITNLLMCLFIGLTRYEEITKGPSPQPFITLVETLMEKTFVVTNIILGKDEE